MSATSSPERDRPEIDFRATARDDFYRGSEIAGAETSAKGVEYHGDFFDLDGAMSCPKPVQSGGAPLHIGGHSRAASRRAGRHGDGLQPLGVVGDQLGELVRIMRQEAEQAGRDPADPELTLGHLVSRITPERTDKLAAQGADRIALAFTAVAGLFTPEGVLTMPDPPDRLDPVTEHVGHTAIDRTLS